MADILATVFVHGIISRPILSVPMEREDVIACLREAMSRRIRLGLWAGEDEPDNGYESEDDDPFDYGRPVGEDD